MTMIRLKHSLTGFTDVPSGITIIIGLLYLFSTAAFNAIIGSQAVCMIISFGTPALIMLITGGSTLPASNNWNFGFLTKPIYVVAVLYSVLVVIVALVRTHLKLSVQHIANNVPQIPQVHPVTSLTMNYTSLIMGAFIIAMTFAWVFEGRKLFCPPTYKELELVVLDGVLDGTEADDEKTEFSGVRDMKQADVKAQTTI